MPANVTAHSHIYMYVSYCPKHTFQVGTHQYPNRVSSDHVHYSNQNIPNVTFLGIERYQCVNFFIGTWVSGRDATVHTF